MPPKDRNNPDDVVFALTTKAPETALDAFPEHAKLIACLIAEYSAMEHKLATMVAWSMGNRKDVVLPMIYAVDSSRARLEAMRAALIVLMEQRAPDTVPRFNALFDTARALLTQRNKFAHALFGKNTKTGELMRIDPSNYDSTEVPLHDIQHQLNRMKDHSFQVGQMLEPLLEKLRAQRQASAPPAPAPQGEQGLGDAQSHPPQPGPPPPSPEKPEKG